MKKNNPSNLNARLIRRKEVQNKTGLGASSIYALMTKGEFPKAVQISERRVAWFEEEVDAWIENKVSPKELSQEASDIEKPVSVEEYLKGRHTTKQVTVKDTNKVDKKEVTGDSVNQLQSSLRDQIAITAMQCLMMLGRPEEKVAELAYKQADAMLKAREQGV